MNARQRLMATLEGKPVDRPAVSFYEIGGFQVDPADPDPYNIYNAPSWQPLLRLAEEQTDVIRMGGIHGLPGMSRPGEDLFSPETWTEGDSRFTRTSVEVGGRTLTQLIRRDRGIDTVWTVEHLLKDAADLRAFLDLPDAFFDRPEPDIARLERLDEAIGDRGIVMVDTADPIGEAAGLFDLSTYILVAALEPSLFHRLLERYAAPIHRCTEHVASAFPGHLWRICGPEYATEPYLPPALFDEYVVRYTEPMVRAVQRHGGYARIHCHGRIKSALPMIAGMGADGIDPIEPPPQGDVRLADVRREYGRDLVLFGNIEVSDIENLEPAAFRKVAEQAVREGTAGEGRGFVLMPTACPYGREISAHTLANYETLVDVVSRG